jgi:hypothetical protein
VFLTSSQRPIYQAYPQWSIDYTCHKFHDAATGGRAVRRAGNNLITEDHHINQLFSFLGADHHQGTNLFKHFGYQQSTSGVLQQGIQVTVEKL